MLYRFDKELRMLIFREIEKIEIAVRCAVVNVGTQMTNNPFWMTDSRNFSNSSKFNCFLQVGNKSHYGKGKRLPVAAYKNSKARRSCAGLLL